MGDMKTVVLGELPLAEKERFFEFLVSNKVEFIAEDDNNFVATIKVVPPQLSTARITGRATALNRSRSSGSIGGPKPASQPRPSVQAPVTDVAATVRAAQTCLRKRYKKFCLLLPSMTLPPKALTTAAILRFAEDVYEDRYEKDAPLIKLLHSGEALGEQQSFPEFTYEFCKHRYGLKQVVSNNCWGFVSSVELLRGQHIGIDTLGRFLDESFDAIDLLFFLSLRQAIEKVLSLGKASTDLADEDEKSSKAQAARAARNEKTNRKKQVFQGDRLSSKQCLDVIRRCVSHREGDLRDLLIKQTDNAILGASESNKGTLEPERFMQVAVQEYHDTRMKKMPVVEDEEWIPPSAIPRDEPEAPELPKPKDLDRSIRKEVKVVCGKMMQSLAAAGQPVDKQACYEWAMQVVLRRNKTGDFMDDVPEDPEHLLCLDEMNDAAEVYQRAPDAPRPSTFMPPIDDLLSLSPDEFEIHLEGNIRQLLLSATSDVISDSIESACGDECNINAIHSALMAEFAPVADTVMEAVVGRDYNGWLRALQIEGSGTQRHRQQFQRLHDEFQEMVSSQIDAEAVLHICRGITSAEEFGAMLRNRALEMNRGGLGGYNDSSDDEK